VTVGTSSQAPCAGGANRRVVRRAALALLLLALLAPSSLIANTTSGSTSYPRVQLFDEMQFDRAPDVLPLGYYLQIRARGQAASIPHLIVQLTGLQGWRLVKSRAFTDCGGRRFVTPVLLDPDAGAWDLGEVFLPAHVDNFGPVYDVSTARRLDINSWGCGMGLILTPDFKLTPASARNHRFLVRLSAGLNRDGIDGSVQIAARRWSGQVVQGPD